MVWLTLIFVKLEEKPWLAKFCPIKTSCVAVSVVEDEGMITGAKVPTSPDPSLSLLHQMTPEMTGR